MSGEDQDQTVERLAKSLAGYAFGPAEQARQVRFRQALVERFGVEPGWKVLEVGCGQGDATVAVAEAVGPTGRVVAVDPGDPTYGAPATLGEAADHLRASEYGSRVEIRLGWSDWEGLASDFDAVILAHCSWYFASREALVSTLRRLRDHAPRLALSEWDLAPTRPAQVPHFLAVEVQGLAATVEPATDRNVRCPLTRPELIAAVREAGWAIDRVDSIDGVDVADGKWEVAAARALVGFEAPEVPTAIRDWIRRQARILDAYEPPFEPLPSLVLAAHSANIESTR